MGPLRLSLSTKAWIIAGFPLLMSTVLLVLLQYAEAESRRERQLRERLDEAVDLTREAVIGSTFVSSYNLGNDPDYIAQYRESVQTAKRKLWELKASSSDVDVKKAIDTVDKSASVVVQIADHLLEIGRLGGRSTAPWEMLELNQQLLSAFEIFTRDLSSFKKELQLREWSQSPLGIYRNIIVYVGILGSLLTGLCMAIFLTKDIGERVKIMIDNTVRLSNLEELNPPVSGNDEISRLDKVFHSMTATINQARGRLLSMIEGMPVGMMLLKEDGVIEVANSAVGKILSYQKEELIGRPVVTLFLEPGRIDVPYGADARTFLSTTFNQTTELDLRKSDGEARRAEVTMTEVETPDGLRFLANIIDVSDRHEMQQMKRQFLAMIAHDIRTPLTSIRGTLALVQEQTFGPLTEAGQKFVRTAESEAVRVLKLFTDLLEIQKYDSTTFEIMPTEFAVEVAIQQAVDAVQLAAQAKNLLIGISSNAACSIIADEDRIVQVLVNLLTNAIKYSPERAQLCISLLETETEVEFRIADQGRGIPAGFEEIIFKPFRQVERADALEKGGTGLGLSICKAIVEGHSGTIGVERHEGPGCTFWFRIPKVLVRSRLLKDSQYQS